MWGNFGEDVRRERRPLIQDPYDPTSFTRGDWDAATSLPLEGAYVAASSSRGPSDATRTQVLTSKSLYVTVGADVQPGDRIVTAEGVWYVNARPEADRNPFTGTYSDMEIPLDRTEG